jgi:hypothetical protein
MTAWHSRYKPQTAADTAPPSLRQLHANDLSSTLGITTLRRLEQVAGALVADSIHGVTVTLNKCWPNQPGEKA